jgi:hypothetical protein
MSAVWYVILRLGSWRGRPWRMNSRLGKRDVRLRGRARAGGMMSAAWYVILRPGRGDPPMAPLVAGPKDLLSDCWSLDAVARVNAG